MESPLKTVRIVAAHAAFLLAFAGHVRSAAAIETGSPGALPPPPPPPPTVSAPRAPPPSRQAPSAPASTSDGAAGSGSATPVPADTGVLDDGRHALDTRIFVAAMLGYSSDEMNFGLGVRAGKTLANHIYVGGSLVYQIGESNDGSASVNAPGVSSNTSYSSGVSGFYVGPEGGYDFDLKYVVLRPYLGLGILWWTASASAGGVSASTTDTKFVVWPGASVVWNVPDSNFFLGGDLRFVSVPGGPAVGFFAFAGMHFGTAETL
jgi:hypothetical protein